MLFVLLLSYVPDVWLCLVVQLMPRACQDYCIISDLSFDQSFQLSYARDKPSSVVPLCQGQTLTYTALPDLEWLRRSLFLSLITRSPCLRFTVQVVASFGASPHALDAFLEGKIRDLFVVGRSYLPLPLHQDIGIPKLNRLPFTEYIYFLLQNQFLVVEHDPF